MTDTLYDYVTKAQATAARARLEKLGYWIGHPFATPYGWTIKVNNVVTQKAREEIAQAAKCQPGDSAASAETSADHDESPERRAEHAEQIRDGKEDR